MTEKTRRLLESIKATCASFDDRLQDLVEETFFDVEFYQEIVKRYRTEKRIPGPRVLRKAGLIAAARHF